MAAGHVSDEEPMIEESSATQWRDIGSPSRVKSPQDLTGESSVPRFLCENDDICSQSLKDLSFLGPLGQPREAFRKMSSMNSATGLAPTEMDGDVHWGVFCWNSLWRASFMWHHSMAVHMPYCYILSKEADLADISWFPIQTLMLFSFGDLGI